MTQTHVHLHLPKEVTDTVGSIFHSPQGEESIFEALNNLSAQVQTHVKDPKAKLAVGAALATAEHYLIHS